ncbi:MAG: hypothetical protein JSV33_14910 [bacterium]|nr:MAG: hypothetical protein JSV33_14910 [bacterium]
MPAKKDDHLEQLLAEIKSFTESKIIGDFFQDTTGLFIPGFTALPAVSILSSESWITRMKQGAERWRPGDLISLKTDAESASETPYEIAFFTPIVDVTIPLIDVEQGKEISKFEKTVELKPNDRWEKVSIHFAVLPWDYKREQRQWTPEELIAISRAMERTGREITVELRLRDRSLDLEPKWALSSWVPERAAESLCFPLNYAYQLLSPFVFRLEFGPQVESFDGQTVDLDMDSLELHFRLREESLRRLYHEAGVGEPLLSGISIFANVLPIMNVDLKAWEPNETFADFVRSSGMKPLGAAGIFPFRKAGKKEFLGPVDAGSPVFSVQIDPSGSVLNHYSLPGEKDTEKKKQFFMWMTHGNALSGYNYTYNETDIFQPLHKASTLMQSAFTIMPCFGGGDCERSDESDWYNRLILGHAIPPQKLLYRDTLLSTIEELITGLGYRDVDIHDPVTELRVIDGARQRVTVVYVRNRGGKPLDIRDIAMIQGYLNDRAPIGSRIIMEVR